jgi:hypothetical protein
VRCQGEPRSSRRARRDLSEVTGRAETNSARHRVYTVRAIRFRLVARDAAPASAMMKHWKLLAAAIVELTLFALFLWWWEWSGPAVVLEFSLGGLSGRDLQFSPDGLTLAVVTFADGPPGIWHWQGRDTRIYRVSDGKLLRVLNGGGLRCAWNWDGSLLAVARDNWPDIRGLGRSYLDPEESTDAV